MKKKRGLKVNIHLSNRWLYFFITLGILAIISVGVYAWDASGAGHNANEIDFSGGVDGEVIFNDNVGIGTDNPQSLLSIGGDGFSAYALFVEGTNGIYAKGDSSYAVLGYGDFGIFTMGNGRIIGDLYVDNEICFTGGDCIDDWSSGAKTPTGIFHDNDFTQNDCYDALSSALPNVGDRIILSGAMHTGGDLKPVSYADRYSSSRIRIFGIRDGGGTTVLNCNNGQTGTYYDAISISW
jgi:hypothetical protein